MVVVDISGRPVALNQANRYAKAILQAFLPGAYGGEALVDVMFGDYNPGGKLPCAFPKTTGQLELNFPTKPGANTEQSGKNRLSVTGVLWPFGFGISYTEFKYANLHVTGGTTSGNITVSFDVTNAGKRQGDEIPQLYIRQLVSSTITWEQALRGFERIHLKPGETKPITFTVPADLLAIWNQQMKRVVEPGKYEAQIGASSADIRLKGEFELTGR
jgi:beta-glucosidase